MRSVGVTTLSTRRSPVFPSVVDDCGCCPEGPISATVAPVVGGVFVDVLLGISLRLTKATVLLLGM